MLRREGRIFRQLIYDKLTWSRERRGPHRVVTRVEATKMAAQMYLEKR